MKIFISFLVLFSVATISRAYDVPPLKGPVMDEVGLLNPSENNELSRLLSAVNSEGLAQIQVAIIKNLQGENIESVSIKMTDVWKLGDAKKDNGILFLIAVEDKKMRIEVGQGFEGHIPDLIARRILETRVQPFFKAGQFSAGVRSGVQEILKRIDPAATQNQEDEVVEPPRKKKNNWMFFIYIFLFIIFSLARSTRSAFGRSGRGSGWYGGGGFGGGSGGGGSWSGGGGGFSGGGSSSDW